MIPLPTSDSSAALPRPYRPAPQIQQLLDLINAANGVGNDLDQMTPTTVPQLWLKRERWAKYRVQSIAVDRVRDLVVPARNHQIPLRIYSPLPREVDETARLPILLYLHGGGWTLGSLATYDSVARALAVKIPAEVVLVDYRLAPEYPFPAALEDVGLALEWIVRNAEQLYGDPQRLVLAGDSGGGTLATVLAWEARQEQIPVVFQALFYPCLDLSRTDSRSYQEYGQGHLLTQKAVEDFRSFYVPNPADWERPEVSPLRMSDAQLRQMPPALLITAGCDPLREDGRAYADRLRANGVAVTERVEEAMIHAFLSFFNSSLFAQISPLVEPILDYAAGVLRGHLASATGPT